MDVSHPGAPKPVILAYSVPEKRVPWRHLFICATPIAVGTVISALMSLCIPVAATFIEGRADLFISPNARLYESLSGDIPALIVTIGAIASVIMVIAALVRRKVGADHVVVLLGWIVMGWSGSIILAAMQLQEYFP